MHRMTRPELDSFPQPEILPEAITRGLIYLTSKHNLGYDEAGLVGLLEQARAGEEVAIPLVAESIWTPDYTPENEVLRRSLDGGWAYSFEEWLWEHGQRFEGTPTEQLRDPATGYLANPAFITTLTQTGKAVELSRRQDERGEVLVNNVWNLWSIVGEEGFWPLATIHTVDADVGESSHWERPDARGPSFLQVPQPIAVGRKVVILPNLTLPWAHM